MSGKDNFHSQMVGWAKILLPLFALGLLSTLFLLARGKTEPSDFAIGEVAEIARDQRVSAPEFSGVATDGSVIVISAQSARPDVDQTDTILIDNINLRIDRRDGSFVDVTALQGDVDGNAQVAQLSGLARLQTSDGYALETSGLRADLKTGVITSDGMLEIQAPFGEMTAGQVTVHTDSQSSGQQILFTNGVRLLYQP